MSGERYLTPEEERELDEVEPVPLSHGILERTTQDAIKQLKR